MGICCAFIRLSDRNIETLVRQPDLVYPLLDFPEVPPPPSGGFLARLFGRTQPASPPAAPLTLPDAREDDDEGDVDKAWQAIHYLLTGTADETDNVLGFLISGGLTLAGTDVGYGPPRAYPSDQVAAIFAALNGLDRATLYQRYQPKAMDQQGVYPKIWARDGDRGFDYIWHHFERLRAVLAEARRRNQGLLVYYT
ncbi:MAG: YfbM family protein [Verrucomicrobiae bacterium]|nr:YfbM family protein [Verrucomicrobiae bacterium]